MYVHIYIYICTYIHIHIHIRISCGGLRVAVALPGLVAGGRSNRRRLRGGRDVCFCCGFTMLELALPELRRNFTGNHKISPESHQKFTGILQNIEFKHLEKGNRLKSGKGGGSQV